MGYILEMKNIEKSFKDIKVLDNACFSIEEGKIHSLVGENAAGKTTLMNILYGMIQADSGDIFLTEKNAIYLILKIQSGLALVWFISILS